MTKRIFGYAVAFSSTNNKYIILSNLNDVIEPSSQPSDKNGISIYMRMSFVENVYLFTYFNVMDILSQLGGISATVSVGVGALVPIFII